MLGLDMLDVAIGLALVYFVFSLAVTAAKEALEARLKYRARDLEAGIRELLDDPDGNTFETAFYQHPMIYALYRGGKYGRPMERPSYIPARNFAVAILDLVDGKSAQSSNHKPSDSLKRAVSLAKDVGGDDLERTYTALEAWYDSAMDRVSGWYKRRTQKVVFWIALLASVACNVDTIAIFKALDAKPEVSKAALDLAQKKIAQAMSAVPGQTRPASAGASLPPASGPTPPPSDPETAPQTPAPSLTSAPAGAAAPAGAGPANSSATGSGTPKAPSPEQAIEAAMSELKGIGLPIGWVDERTGGWRPKFADVPTGIATVSGWLLTAFAVMLGSPFWFDVLNRLMVIRSTVKPHEKSPEEASEDKQRPAKKGDTPSAPSPPVVVHLVPQAPAGTVPPMAGAVRSVVSDGVGTTDASIATASLEDDADEHEDGCLCDHLIDAKDETVDHDLPPATGGVAAAR